MDCIVVLLLIFWRIAILLSIVAKPVDIATTVYKYFLIPVFLKNGQTVGKKCFGICVMHQNSVKVRNVPLLIRALLGKFTIETMIPIYIGIMFIFGSISILQIFILLLLVIVQVVMLITNRYNALIHDAMSYTVVVDKETQMIFDSEEDLIKYKEQKAAEQEKQEKTF